MMPIMAIIGTKYVMKTVMISLVKPMRSTASSDVFSPGNKLSGALDWKSDTLTASHLLKVDGNGFGSVDFGPILRDGVSLTDLESVFSVSATFDGGEVASAVQFVNLAIVPEPSNGLLMMLPAILLLVCRRR